MAFFNVSVYNKVMYLYFICHKIAPQYVKIGYTADLNMRLKQLSTASPTGIDVLAVYEVDDGSKFERIWHSRFNIKRCQGEWFLLSEHDVAYVKEQMTRYLKENL